MRLKELLPIRHLPEEARGSYSSLGGLVMMQLGRMARASDRFDWQGFRFDVVDMDGSRIDKVLVSPVEARPVEVQ